VSDVVSRRLLGYLGPLHLAPRPKPLDQWSSTFFVQSPPTGTLLKNRPSLMILVLGKYCFNLKS